MAPTCFDALDAHVIGGAADRVALTAGGQSWTCARLLEEVAAFGGALRHCGVSPGDRVVIALPPAPEAVIAVLACARIGARHGFEPDPDARVLIAGADRAPADDDPPVVLVTQRPDATRDLREGRDYDWDVVLRAGRTDPAPWLAGATVTPYDEQTAAWVQPLVDGGMLALPDSP